MTLDSLTCWNSVFLSRRHIADRFTEKYELDKHDKEFLNKYKEIRTRLSWGNIEWCFHHSGGLVEMKHRSKLVLKDSDRNLLLLIINQFWSRFSILYSKDFYYLKERRETMLKNLKESFFQSALEDINYFFRINLSNKEIPVSLIPGFSERSGSGMGFSRPSALIVLETTNLRTNDQEAVKRDLSVLLHEFSHIVINFEENNFKDIMEEILEKEGASDWEKHTVEEAIIRSNFPSGILAVRSGLLKKIPESLKKTLSTDPTQKLTSSIIQITEEQIKNGNHFNDPKYIKEVLKILRSIKN